MNGVDASVRDAATRHFALDHSSGASFTHDAIALLFSLLHEVVGRHDADILRVAWGAMTGPLGPALLGAKGRRFHLAGRLELSLWGGRERVRLRLDDAAPVG